MTETELMAAIEAMSPQALLDRLAALAKRDRRKLGASVLADYKRRMQADMTVSEGLKIALLATASLSQLKQVWLQPVPGKLPIDAVFRALKPDWTEAWVDWMIAENPAGVGELAPLWTGGICPRPVSDAFILSYYVNANWRRGAFDEATFLKTDVWRFFEVEGGGEFSLASHDKYTQPQVTWSAKLLKYAAAGKLDRDRLLDASLDSLARDFAQFRAGWYARLHTALDPTPAEMAARAERYLGLLQSMIPPTVSFAIKAVQKLEKGAAVSPEALLTALEAPLQARQKGTVMAALRLLASVARRDRGLAPAAGAAAVLALVSEAAEVQGKALDLIEKLGASEDADVRRAMGDYIGMVAPSVRPRLAALMGAEAETAPEEAASVAEPARATPVQPVETPEAALAALLGVLESQRDPFEVERAMDGLARFGAVLCRDEEGLSPLGKRALTLCRRSGDSVIAPALALTARALVEGRSVAALVTPDSSREALVPIRSGTLHSGLLARSEELLAQVRNGLSLPMLSLPSDSGGSIRAGALVTRLDEYRAAGREPGCTDLALALLRLAPEGRAEALARLSPETEADRALAYALGGAQGPRDKAALWAAAWATRLPVAPDPRIVALFSPPLPDCGTPAPMEISLINRDYWIEIQAPVPQAQGADVAQAIPAMFYVPKPHRFWHVSPSGSTYADVAWAGLVRPVSPEPFFRDALLNLDTTQKLSDHYACAYLEPFFRPGPACGPMALTALALYLASEDKALAGLTVAAIASLAREGRLEAAGFAAALRPFVLVNSLPTARWTRALAALAEAGEARLARDVATGVISFGPEETPRDIGGMLALLYELHLATGTVPRDAATLACLRAIPGGGKVATFARKLLQMAH